MSSRLTITPRYVVSPVAMTTSRWKYARPELERRFLLPGLPPGPMVRSRRIEDRYFPGTRLRLRSVTDTGRPGRGPEYKLTQKVPAAGPGGPSGWITTIYLSPVEYQLLATLPGAELRKVRHSLPPFGVDVFEGALEGLTIAECEAPTIEDLVAQAAPESAAAEVTDDPRFSGGRLAQTTVEELTALLAEYGIGQES